MKLIDFIKNKIFEYKFKRFCIREMENIPQCRKDTYGMNLLEWQKTRLE